MARNKRPKHPEQPRFRVEHHDEFGFHDRDYHYDTYDFWRGDKHVGGPEEAARIMNLLWDLCEGAGIRPQVCTYRRRGLVLCQCDTEEKAACLEYMRTHDL